jgi:hypothetical protein
MTASREGGTRVELVIAFPLPSRAFRVWDHWHGSTKDALNVAGPDHVCGPNRYRGHDLIPSEVLPIFCLYPGCGWLW